MGTSHRQAPVKFVVGSLRNGLAELLQLPDGYEIILGNGGTHAFWDGLTAGFVEHQSLHATFGEFSSKFAKAIAAAPFLADPVIVESEVGRSEEHTSELQSLMRIQYAVFCLKKKITI